jgi:glycogen synthase
MKKTPHVIWVCPNSQLFFRSKGEVKARPGSVIPKLIEQGFKIDVLIPHDPSLLPKSKLAPSRVTKHEIKLSQTYRFEITKLTRGSNSPGIFMAKLPILEAPLYAAIFSKAAMALAKEINKPVDVFHLFGWEAGLLPLYLELEKSGSRIFQNTRTFFSVGSLRNQGNFSPGILNYIGIPKELFHPEGIEFFGKMIC